MAGNITELLHRAEDGDDGAKAELFETLYEDLHSQASRLMRGQLANHTLQPTALVNEAYLRLARGGGGHWADRQHFLAVAAKAMRCVVVDHARGKQRKKRGGDAVAVPLSSLTLAFENHVVDLIALDEALHKLDERDARAARVVELRFFGGLSVAEAAAVLGAPVRSMERDWELARAWLFRELSK
jgi:RNA polymerase sigma-70 factor (ECF subfamily)